MLEGLKMIRVEGEERGVKRVPQGYQVPKLSIKRCDILASCADDAVMLGFLLR
jgi:hypothetical protein